MLTRCFVFLCLLKTLVAAADSVILNSTETLHDAMLAGYYRDVRPGIGDTLTVNVTFHITSLNDLDEVRGEMNLVGFLTATWIEDRISWNPALYSGIVSILLPMDKVWTPPLLVGNPSLKVSSLNGAIAPVRYFYNGVAVWNPGDVFRTKCYPDIYRYPFDGQECYISLVPWGYRYDEIGLVTPTDKILKPFYNDNGEWILMDSNVFAYVHPETGMSLAQITFMFQRRSQFFVVNVILPIVFLSYLNCLVYFIPTQSGERISYTITVLLSFAVFMTLVSDNIPKTSAPMSLLCYYLISIFSGSALIVVSTIFNMAVYYRKPTEPISNGFKILTRKMRRVFCSNRRLEPVNDDAHAHGTTVVQVIDLDAKKMEHEFEDKVEGLEHDRNHNEHIEDEITWKDVGEGLDKISLIIFFLYFTVATIAQLLAIALPS